MSGTTMCPTGRCQYKRERETFMMSRCQYKRERETFMTSIREREREREL